MAYDAQQHCMSVYVYKPTQLRLRKYPQTFTLVVLREASSTNTTSSILVAFYSTSSGTIWNSHPLLLYYAFWVLRLLHNTYYRYDARVVFAFSIVLPLFLCFFLALCYAPPLLRLPFSTPLSPYLPCSCFNSFIPCCGGGSVPNFVVSCLFFFSRNFGRRDERTLSDYYLTTSISHE